MLMDSDLQNIFDDGVFAFSQNNYEIAKEKFEKVLESHPDHFDALSSLAMTFYRQENYEKAIEIGLIAEKLKPNEQAVHTNLSLFYMRNGMKEKAEHHGLQARIAGWKSEDTNPGISNENESSTSLDLATPKPENIKIPPKFPEMPWKKEGE